MREEELEEQFLYFDQQHCFFGDEPFEPLVWMGGDPITSRFNTLSIPVSLASDADLDFEEALSLAEEAKERGLKIVFDLDLGLFDRLKMPLESNILFSSLTLAIETFKSALLEPYSSITLGVIAYKGSAHFHKFLEKDFSLYESLSLWIIGAYGELASQTPDRSVLIQAYFEMGIRFIERVTESLPAKFPVFVLLDFEGINDSALTAFLLNRERLGRVLFAPKNMRMHYYGMSFEEEVQPPFAFFGSKIPNASNKIPDKTYGVLLPSIENKNLGAYKEIGEAIDFFMSKNIHFRLIPETLFVSEWDAVDLLFVPKDLSKEAIRMIKGYLASQGDLVLLSPHPEFPQAIEFDHWNKQ